MKKKTAVIIIIMLVLGGCGMQEKEKDIFRPGYHFSVKENWGNDPNGLIYYEGEYHFFYQCNPNAKDWGGDKYWGHAVSKDLLSWDILQPALFPDDLGSCWSGSVVADVNNTSGLFPEQDKGGLVAIYTAFSENISQCIAYSSDNGRTWAKYDGNPVIDRNNNPGGSEYFRDPKVLWHEASGQWLMVISGGPLMMYTSNNLIDWECHFTDRTIDTECPDLFRITVENTGEEKWVLLMSGKLFMVGELKNAGSGIRFVPETEKIPVPGGPDTYATQVWANTPDSRILSISWLCDMAYVKELINTPTAYSGTYSMIKEVKLIKERESYVLIQIPLNAYESLRTDEEINLRKTLEGKTPINGFSGTQYEISAVFLPDGNTYEFGFVLFAGDDCKTVIKYDAKNEKAIIDRSESGIDIGGTFLEPGIYEYPAERNNKGEIEMHIFADNSVIECFFNEKSVASFMLYPYEDNDKIYVFSSGGQTDADIKIYALTNLF